MTQSLHNAMGLTPKPDQSGKLKPFSRWKARDTSDVVTVFCVAKNANPNAVNDIVVYAHFGRDDQPLWLYPSQFLQAYEYIEEVQAYQPSQPSA